MGCCFGFFFFFLMLCVKFSGTGWAKCKWAQFPTAIWPSSPWNKQPSTTLKLFCRLSVCLNSTWADTKGFFYLWSCKNVLKENEYFSPYKVWAGSVLYLVYQVRNLMFSGMHSQRSINIFGKIIHTFLSCSLLRLASILVSWNKCIFVYSSGPAF